MFLGGFQSNAFQSNAYQNAIVAPAQFGYAILVALSQTGIQGAQSAYIAGSASVVTAAYFDLEGDPFIPNAVSYSIVDVVSGTQIATGVPIAMPGLTNSVTITSLQNAMISLSRNSEVHQVIFEITDGLGDVNFAQVSFDIIAAPPNPLADCGCTS